MTAPRILRLPPTWWCCPLVVAVVIGGACDAALPRFDNPCDEGSASYNGCPGFELGSTCSGDGQCASVDPQWQCIDGACACVPNCPASSECGSDGCSEDTGCGTCGSGEICSDGLCITSPCAGRECGSSGGMSCGDCSEGDVCSDGSCVADCALHGCLATGCECEPGSSCVDDTCTPDCGNGSCSWPEDCDTCEADCGACPKGPCDEVHGEPGCDDPVVEACVCYDVPACCSEPWLGGWTALCVDVALCECSSDRPSSW